MPQVGPGQGSYRTTADNAENVPDLIEGRMSSDVEVQVLSPTQEPVSRRNTQISPDPNGRG